ncbi:MAG: alpha/beta hydrolase [Rikenellaceae bacterium]
MKSLFIACFCLVSCSLFAQESVTLRLWENGAPNSNGITEKEYEPRKDRITNVTDPTLTIYPAENPNGKAVIMCPGGGYSLVAIHHEGFQMADWFNSMGITYAVLKYRMPNGNKEVPLSDAHRAIELMRENSEKWDIDKVGIMGCSAGGHLASTAATHYTAENRPDFQILLYPVINMNAEITHVGSRNQLLGKNASVDDLDYYSNELQVSADTPPAFIVHSSDDAVVPVKNSIDYYMSLINNKVSASLHIYPTGGHGWGFNDNFKYKDEWTTELGVWLKNLEL